MERAVRSASARAGRRGRGRWPPVPPRQRPSAVAFGLGDGVGDAFGVGKEPGGAVGIGASRPRTLRAISPEGTSSRRAP